MSFFARCLVWLTRSAPAKCATPHTQPATTPNAQRPTSRKAAQVAPFVSWGLFVVILGGCSLLMARREVSQLDVPMLSRPVAPYEVITISDIVTDTIRADQVMTDTLRDAQDVIDRYAGEGIKPRQPLRASQLGLIPDPTLIRDRKCCLAAGGSWEDAIPAAAAVEMFMVALDILDDEEDREHTQLKVQLGNARTLNASTGLLFLAQRGLAETYRGDRTANVLLEAGLRACSGQHSDLASTAESAPRLDECLAVTAGKSASLVEAICRLGAICANADPETEALWASFGWHLGMVEQLVNDIWALRPGAVEKTDVELHKPTIPLTYAAIADDYGDREDRVMTGLYLTWTVADVYRRQALELIDRLTTDQLRRADLIALLPTLS